MTNKKNMLRFLKHINLLIEQTHIKVLPSQFMEQMLYHKEILEVSSTTLESSG